MPLAPLVLPLVLMMPVSPQTKSIQPIKKDHYGLMINHYPASAWLEVFGVNIQEVLYKKSFDEAS